MKNSIIFLVALLMVSTSFASAPTKSIHPEFVCNEIAHFTQPSQPNIPVGDDMYVRVEFNDDQFVISVKLFIGHQPIRTDLTAPYEWGIPNSTADPQLRNMPAGNYALGIKVNYSCGNTRTFTKHIKVGSNGIVLQKHNPIRSLVWLKRIHQTQPNSKISEYRKGSSTLYKIEPCRAKVGYVNWYDPNGRLAGKLQSSTNNQGRFNYAKLVKTWYDPCR